MSHSTPAGSALPIGSALPPLHSAWLTGLTGIRNLAPEPRATCSDCAMCAPKERSGSQVTFSPDVKCCSYIPHLANFLTGRALAGGGRASVQARIGRRDGVTPLGLGLTEHDIRRMVSERSGAGEGPVVRCPHFVEETSGCAIWESRNAVCSTWFCKHERGAVGQRLWHAVRDLLMAAEERIAYKCLTEADLPQHQVDAVLEHRVTMRETVAQANSGELPAVQTDIGSAAWYSRMWGAWEGREEEWFSTCGDLATALDTAELTTWMDGVRHLVEQVEQKQAALNSHDLPGRLRFAPGPGSEATADVLRLVGYSPFDPVVVPASLQPGLWLLDGRPVSAAQGDSQLVEGVTLENDLLQALHDYGVALTADRVVALPTITDLTRLSTPEQTSADTL